MQEELILAIDAGTTGIRAVLYRRDSQQAAYAYEPITQYTPEVGWLEHDPLEIYETVIRLIKNVCEQAGIAENHIAAMGIATQRGTTVAWNKATGKPIDRKSTRLNSSHRLARFAHCRTMRGTNEANGHQHQPKRCFDKIRMAAEPCAELPRTNSQRRSIDWDVRQLARLETHQWAGICNRCFKCRRHEYVESGFWNVESGIGKSHRNARRQTGIDRTFKHRLWLHRHS